MGVICNEAELRLGVTGDSGQSFSGTHIFFGLSGDK
jgi:hypothetical protein